MSVQLTNATDLNVRLCRSQTEEIEVNKMNGDLLQNSISLKDAVRVVQDELIKSQKEREENNIQPLFEVERLTIEANCVFTKTEVSEVGFEVKLLSLFSAKSSQLATEEKSYVHQIKLELKAVGQAESAELTGIHPYESKR